MTTVTLTIQAAQQKIKSVSLPRISWKLVYFIGICAVVLMVISYIYLVNQLTEGVYLIKNYNKEINTLYQQNEILENKFAQVNFLEKVMTQTKAMSFEKTKDIKYVQILDTSLAKAK